MPSMFRSVPASAGASAMRAVAFTCSRARRFNAASSATASPRWEILEASAAGAVGSMSRNSVVVAKSLCAKSIVPPGGA
jgi:hypothetical protein